MKIVLLPGLDGTGKLFKPLIEALPESTSIQVITYPETQKLNYSELTTYVTARLPKEDFILVGESFSGNIAYQIILDQPEHLKSVIFVASFLSNPRPFILTLVNLLPTEFLFSISLPKLTIKIFMLGFSAQQSLIQLFKEALRKP